MAKVTQVVLMGAASYRDNRYVFKQNVPVTMRDAKEADKYAGNALFAVRTVEESRADAGISGQKLNPGDPFQAAVSDDSVRLPRRKKKAAKKLTPKQGE
jgi:hypothetical protein